MRVIVSEPISEQGLEILRREASVDVFLDLSAEDLASRLPGYDALLVRSQTKVTASLIAAGTDLKVIGRAGVGVDNIDVEAASERGIIVVNAPEGNIIAAAEHTMAMMAALARNIPAAHASLCNAKWQRNSFIGVELYKKTLGIVGLGQVGSEVAKRAKGFDMRVIAFDPYVSTTRAEKLGVRLATLDEIWRESDFITFHVPKTKETAYMVGARELGLMKEGVRLVNCARGGIIDEAALCEAITSGKVGGAALDVFESEPPGACPLLKLDQVVGTPHLGGSTYEAQVNVAVEVAEQILAALKGLPLTAAVNAPSIPSEALAVLAPYITLAEHMGSFFVQAMDGGIHTVEISCLGEIASYPVTPLTNSFLKGLFKIMLGNGINAVNAPVLARQRGIRISETKSASARDFANLVSVRVDTDQGTRTIAGTLFGTQEPRIVQLDGYRMDISPAPYMLVSEHIDKPGIIGKVGTILGTHRVNIAGMQVGRKSIGGEAVMVLQVDHDLEAPVLRAVEEVDGIIGARVVRL
ncbi:MAG: phosphoglycerate dehydrogenase [Firmicutes bacterium]|nr:phosphoglycerate dehydrogenase [Bacillota bacterium]